VSTGWITPLADNPLKVECKYCEVILNANLADIKRHAKTSKHARHVMRHSTPSVQQRKAHLKTPKSAATGISIVLVYSRQMVK